MCAKRATTHIVELIGYTIPSYHEGKNSYIDFYFYDSELSKIRRKKYHLDSIPSKRKRKAYATVFISELTKKLMTGWRPWNSQNGIDKEEILFTECLDKYLERIKKFGKERTIHTYTSYINIIKEFLKISANPPKFVSDFNKEFVVEFLDWLLMNREVGPRTRNNYRNWLNIFSEYLIERKYINENPTIGTGKLKEQSKFRKPLSQSMLQTLTNYLTKNDKDFLLAVMLEYYCFIRPKELRLIKIQDISVKNQSILIAGNISKNGRTATVALNDTIIKMMLETGCLTSPSSYYLFGNDFKPSETKCTINAINIKWDKVRKALGFGTEYQFYSLKDSGIRDLANQAGIVTAKRQARHTDISTTNKYLEGEDMPLPEELKHFKGGIK